MPCHMSNMVRACDQFARANEKERKGKTRQYMPGLLCAHEGMNAHLSIGRWQDRIGGS